MDEYTLDQLVIFMALARGHSRVRCPKPSSISSEHLPTTIHFTQLLCGTRFAITPITETRPGTDDVAGCFWLECDGIGSPLT